MTDFTPAIERAAQIRALYHELEKRGHGGEWNVREDMIGFTYDVGELGKLIMAAEGRWAHEGDVSRDLGEKLSECLWWLLVFSDRLGIDLNEAFQSKMTELETSLAKSVRSVE